MPMPQAKVTTTVETPKDSILNRSGLDVTLEGIQEELKKINNKLDESPTRLEIDTLKREIFERKEAIDQKLKELEATKVSVDDYKIVKQLVFGAVAIILIAVITALVFLVVKQGG